MEKLHRRSRIAKITEPISAKPNYGLYLGVCRLTFRYADHSAISFEGEISDVTGLFLGQAIQQEFKEIVLEEINLLEANAQSDAKAQSETLNNGGTTDLVAVTTTTTTPQDSKSKKASASSAINSAKTVFKNFNFSDACRVVLLEEHFNHQKHLILQIGRLALLPSYAYNNDSSQWSIIRGLKYDFIVDGSTSTLPHQQRLRDLGDLFIHIFIPDDHIANSKLDTATLDKAKALLGIVPFIPQTVDVEQYLKAKDDELQSKEDTMKRMRMDLSEKSVRNDAGSIGTASYERFNHNDEAHPNRFDFTDALLIAVPSFLIAVIGLSFNPLGWLGGFGLGFPVGCYLVNRRK
jgi:hypothetical protein